MAAAANIVLNDGAGSPVARTFVPVAVSAMGVTWEELTVAPTLEGRWRIEAKLFRPKIGQKESRVKISFYEPVLANISNSTVTGVEPAPQVAYVPRWHNEFYVPSRAAGIDLNHLVAIWKNAAANSVLADIVKQLALPY